jgi:hypothetical protein
MQRLPLIFAIAGALARGHDIDAVIAEDALQLRDIGQPRHVVENERFLGQQTRDHQRQRGILGARDGNGAVERASADDANAVHAKAFLLRIRV